jgi:glucose-6-phosphate 1-dehydrogenase
MTKPATTPASSSPASSPADVLVIFGITGDLAKKMTFRSLYRLERRRLLDCPIVGVARRGWSDEELHTHARTAITDSGETIDDAVFARFAKRLSMVSGNYDDAETYERLGKAIEGKHTPVFYLEIPPSLFGQVVDRLAEANLTDGARVVIEKPFGHDLASARDLNDELRRHLAEWQIFRIDHFLGKEPAMDIMFLRFANTIFEPLWNRDKIRSVQITMAESIGVEDRGSFYDAVGALRDVVQNHLLQLVGLFAAEPPSVADADGLRDKRVEVFRAIPSVEPAQYVRGQYDGYQSINGVQPDSQTETFAALRLEIDNWRWAGVPFFIRAGKALPVRATEIRVIFKRPPRLAITPHAPEANELILRIDPSPGTDLVIQAKAPGVNRTRTVDLSLIFADELGEAPEPYERLLSDAMRGDSTQFTRQDTVAETWRIVQPLLDAPPLVESYPSGTWGPSGAEKLVAGHPGWRKPWLP